MRTSVRGAKAARLHCEALEDRVTPVVAYALTGAGAGTGSLLAFDTATPSIVTTTAITGLNAADVLVGIDFRPQNGFLYGLGVNDAADTATLYTISTRTGRAAIVADPALGATPTAGQIAFTGVDLPAASVGWGFDFNPQVDRIRVTTGNGLNFRVDPNTGQEIDGDGVAGAPIATDTNVTGVVGGGGVSAATYTNSQPNTTLTTLYALSDATDSLYIQGQGANPNGGVETLVAAVTLNGAALNFDAINGFDVPAGVNTTTANQPVVTGSGLAVLTVGGASRLYSINLTNGAATLVGTVGNGASVSGFAVHNDLGGYTAIALDNSAVNTAALGRFNTLNPSATVIIVNITGDFAASGESLVGIDFRPQTGQFYGLGVNAGTGNGSLYLIDPQTGASTRVSAAGSIDLTAALPDPATASYGFDFNPTVDRIRVTTTTGLNFRVNPNDGTVAGTDAVINGGGSTGVSAAAYTNSFGQVLGAGNPTTLYTLDSDQDMLFIQNPPNNGTQSAGKLVTFNGARLDFSTVNGFDIPAGVGVSANNAVATGVGYATLIVGGNTSLYKIDLSTGVATAVAVNSIATIDGLALADTPGGTIQFQSATTSGTEGAANLNVVLTRTATTGAQTVTVNVTGGSASPGSDFPAGPYTVTFVDGATTATLNIPFTSDGVVEGTETVVLTITAAPGGAIGAQNSTTVSVTDTPPVFGRVFGTGGSIPALGVIPPGGGAAAATFPYGATPGGIRVAQGDVTGDGIPDLVTVPTTGAPLVLVFNGATGAIASSFLAYPVALNIPASIAVGDVNNDGFADIVIGTTTSFTAVLVFSGKDNSLIGGPFFPFGALPIGVNVAVGDTDGDNQLDIILGTTSTIAAVAVFNGQTFAQKQLFFPFGGFPSGVTVAAGDLDNDGTDEIVLGIASLVPAFAVFKGSTLQTVIFPFAGATGGVNVAVNDTNGDGQLDIVAGLASGPAGVATYDGKTLSLLNTLFPFGGFNGGIFVA